MHSTHTRANSADSVAPSSQPDGRRKKHTFLHILSSAIIFGVTLPNEAKAQEVSPPNEAKPSDAARASEPAPKAASGAEEATTSFARGATAQPPGPSAGTESASPSSWIPEVRLGAGLSNFGGNGTLGFRVEAPSGFALSAHAFGNYGTWFVGGFPSDKANTLGGTGLVEIPLSSAGRTRFSLRTGLGARSTGGKDFASRSFVATGELGLRATFQATPDLELYAGTSIPVALAIRPEFELEELSNVQELGADYWVSPNVALTAQMRAGNIFGYGGDGAKALVHGQLGVRVAFEPHRPVETKPDQKDPVGLFVALEWRAQGLASHLSHGPAFAAGVSLLNRHLKIGFFASTRPGPLNGETFPTRPANGQTYKGKSTIPLRSDGAMVGLVIAPSFDVTEHINLELPIGLGQSAYGFYLTGDDRKTPDGKRVSEWEKKLFDGRDAAPAFGIEGGLKVGVRIPGARWLKPYVAGRYTLNLGYDAYVTNNYNGPSGAFGIEIEN
jgi:hypothetical protein